MVCPKSQPCYDGSYHFISSINARPEALMAMFTLYCDDSGTHPKSDIAVAGCYVSTVEQWSEFKRNWQNINQRENFGVFHMADFVARREQFALPEWQDDAKRDRTIRSLIGIIKTRAKMGFCVAVEKSAFDEIIGADLRKRYFAENHYSFAVRLCTALVDEWRQRHKYSAPVQYVFDRLSKGKGEIGKLFTRMLSGGDDAFRRYGVYEDCWSFQNKAEVVQLQAADIWAYENYRFMVDCFMPAKMRGEKNKPRKSYSALLDSPIVVRYHIRQTLIELVRQLKQKHLA